MVQNGQGDIDDMLDRLAVEMGDAAEVLSRRKVTLAAALYSGVAGCLCPIPCDETVGPDAVRRGAAPGRSAGSR